MVIPIPRLGSVPAVVALKAQIGGMEAYRDASSATTGPRARKEERDLKVGDDRERVDLKTSS